MRIKDWIPPVISRARRRSSLHGSWQAAEASCGLDAYQGAGLVDVVFAKTERLRDTIALEEPLAVDGTHWHTPLAVGMAARDGTVRVIELGGACGAEYFMLRRLFRAQLRLCWAVVETPAMVRRAGALADGALTFFEDIPAAVGEVGVPDLVFSSGTLQYCSNAYDLLGQMLDAGARYLFLTRLLLTERPADLFGVQKSSLAANGPGPLPAGMADRAVRYPVRALARTEVERAIGRRYVTMARFREVPDAFRFGPYWASTHGFLCSVEGTDR